MQGKESIAPSWTWTPRIASRAVWTVLCGAVVIAGACGPADPASKPGPTATVGAPGGQEDASRGAEKKCNKIKPPKKKDVPDNQYVSVMANSYVAGGVMISVHVNEPVDQGPGYGQLAEVRTWANNNSNASTSRPPSGSDADRPAEARVRARTPDGWWDLRESSGLPWAGSTIVRASTDETIWVYVEVKLCMSTGAPCNADGSGTPSGQNRRFWQEWIYDSAASPPQWVPEEQEWVYPHEY